MKSAEEIRERQQAMCTGQMQDLDEQTKRLQQVEQKRSMGVQESYVGG
jgi:hypothetical protein